jgi:hypothetical protein
MSENSVWGLLETLQDTAQSVLRSGAAVVSDLQQQIAEAAKQQQNHYGKSSSSSTSYLRKLNDAKEELLAQLRWSTPLLQVCNSSDCRQVICMQLLLQLAEKQTPSNAQGGSTASCLCGTLRLVPQGGI